MVEIGGRKCGWQVKKGFAGMKLGLRREAVKRVKAANLVVVVVK